MRELLFAGGALVGINTVFSMLRSEQGRAAFLSSLLLVWTAVMSTIHAMSGKPWDVSNGILLGLACVHFTFWNHGLYSQTAYAPMLLISGIVYRLQMPALGSLTACTAAGACISVAAQVAMFGLQGPVNLYQYVGCMDVCLHHCCAPRLMVPGDDKLFPTSKGAIRIRCLHPASRPPQCPGVAPPPTLVIIPDGPAVVEHMTPLAQAACDAVGCTAVLLDLPGFGFSIPTAGHTHDFVGTAVAIHTALSAAGHTAAGVILHGSCLPGLYALAFAKAFPDITKGVLLAQTPSPEHLKAWAHNTIPRPLVVPYLGQCAMFCLRRQFAGKWFRMASAKNDPKRTTRSSQWATKAHCNMDEGGCFCLASAVQGTLYADELPVSNVPASIPVACLWGSGDRSHKKTPPDSIKALVPHATVRNLGPGVGHFPSMECQSAFLEELLPLMQ